jgi:hypothetical protein
MAFDGGGDIFDFRWDIPCKEMRETKSQKAADGHIDVASYSI